MQKSWSNILAFLLILSGVFLLVSKLFRNSRTTPQNVESVDQEAEEIKEITGEQAEDWQELSKPERSQKFYKMLIEKGLAPDMAKMITAQAMHESAVFSSNVFRRNNNPFGMKNPAIRDTTSTGSDGYGYAMYTSIEDSIQDYLLYREAFEYPETFPDTMAFAKFLKSKGYFEAATVPYHSALSKHYNSLNSIIQ